MSIAGRNNVHFTKKDLPDQKEFSTVNNFIVPEAPNVQSTTSGVDLFLAGNSKKYQNITPTSDIDVTLPDSNREFILINQATPNVDDTSGPGPMITVKSDNGDVVRRIYPGTSGHVISLVATPSTQDDWKALGRITSIPQNEPIAAVDGNGSALDFDPGASANRVVWWREGKHLVAHYEYRHSGASRSSGVGIYNWLLPNGLIFDHTTYVKNSGGGNQEFWGTSFVSDSPASFTQRTGQCKMFSGVPSTFDRFFAYASDGNSPPEVDPIGQGFFDIATPAIHYSFNIKVPILGWSEENDN